MFEAVVWLVVIAGVVMAFRHLGDRRTHVGGAGAGTVYDWLNEDKRKAIEIVVEGRAEQRDPEHADDTVPDDAAAEQPQRR